METAINRYKYEGKVGWALIFGRILSGFMHQHEPTFRQFALITSSPTYTGAGGRDFDHTWAVLEAADAESFGAWPFERDVILKTAPQSELATASRDRGGAAAIGSCGAGCLAGDG